MGDKAILTEVLEASRLSEHYPNLTATRLIGQLKRGGDASSSVHYDGLEGDQIRIGEETDDARRGAPSELGGGAAGGGGVPDVFTVDDAVEYLGFGRFQIVLSCLTGLAWMADAMEMMILSILSPALVCEWNISPMEQAMITTCVFSGMMLSSTVWGKVCDRFGRRTGLMCAAMITFMMGAMSSGAPNFRSFLFMRALTGIGIGGVPQSVTLYAEFLPIAQRAKCVVLIESFWAVGAAFEASLALLIMSTWGWRWLLLLSSTPLLLFSLSCLWLPESARFLMGAGKPEQALLTLQRVAKLNGRSLPSGKLIESSAALKAEHRGRLRHLFVPDLARTTLLLWLIWAFCAFCYYGVVLFTTVLFQSGDQCHGGLPPAIPPPPSAAGNITFGDTVASDTVMNDTKSTQPTACKPLVQKDYFDLLSTTLSEFPGLILTAVIIEWFGRKRTMQIEFGVYAFFIFLLFFCIERHWVTAFIFIARAFISGAFQCVYVYTPEVYPTTLRALGLGASSSMARLGAIATPFVAQVASGHSLMIPIGMYCTAALLGLLAAIVLPIETKGRQMKETH